MKKINIFVVGLGFVGLTTALAFAKKRFNVTAIDTNKIILKNLKKNLIHFHEPFLKERLIHEKKRNKLIFSNNIRLDSKYTNIIFICVGTPSNNDGSANLKQINTFLYNLKKKVKDEKILILIKSTVPPGSTIKFKKIFKQNKNVTLASNPEFLREGSAWKDFFASGKIVIGTTNKSSILTIKSIYKSFKEEIVFTSENTAEFIKYLSNVFLANLISFSNSMMMLAEQIGDIDVKKSFKTLKMDNRFKGNYPKILEYLNPGIGFGGYCLPKDTKSLSYISNKNLKNNILDIVLKVNDETLKYQAQKIIKTQKKNIFILGLSFKPGSDDIRFSKSIELVKILQKNKNKKIYTSDPKCFLTTKNLFNKNVKVLKKPKLIKNTVYVIATAWDEYLKFAKKIEKKNLLDLRYKI